MKFTNLLKLLLVATALSIFFTACKKDEGVGGTSTIVGKVFVKSFDVSFQSLIRTYPDAGREVFIIYGDSHSTYDDSYKASYDGSFQFKYLQKGKYKLFIYVKDTTGAYLGNYNSSAPRIPKFVNVEITTNGSNVATPDMYYLDNNN